MLNAKWYLLCNTVNNRAFDLLQIPEIWKNTTGMAQLDDEALATFNQWSSEKNEVFLSVPAARAAGIDNDSIDAVLAVTLPMVRNWVRAMRDPLLAETDKITTPDRWAKLDVVSKNDIELYRQALRDIPGQDPFNIAWPFIPEALAYIRTFDTSAIERPSKEFLDKLAAPTPAKTIEQIRNDQWLRIHAERERRKAGGVRVTVGEKNYWFWTDDTSRAQYSILEGRARRAGLSSETVLDLWKTMSGEFVPLTVGLLHKVLDVGIACESNLFNIAENHRARMLASNDPLNYDYLKGWPATYEESAAGTN